MEPSATPTPLGLRVLRVLVGLTVAAFVLTTIGHLVDLLILDREIRLLDVEDRRSIAAWASTAALVLASAAAALLALVRRPLQVSLIVMAITLALLSAEDGIGLFGQLFRRSFASVGIVMAMTAVLALRVAGQAPHPLGRPVWIGLGALVVAVAGEAVVLLIDHPALDLGELLYEAEVIMEEGFELLGVGLIASSLVAITIDDVVRGPADRP